MQFELTDAVSVLERTPQTFTSLLAGLSPNWLTNSEGAGTWNAKEIVAHLIHMDRANWLRRATLLITKDIMVSFDPLNREGGLDIADQTVEELLDLFQSTRTSVLSELAQLQITHAQYGKSAVHPDFGVVKLSQLLSAWVVHDLNHLSQASRVLAKQYREEVGPWIEYLRILK